MKKTILISLLTVLCFAVTAQNKYNVYVAKYQGDREAAISYTFDDGLSEHYTIVFPEFEKRGLKGTFWINGSKVNEDPQDIRDTTRVTWLQLKEMSDYGHEISNHGWAHRNFGRHTEEEIREDIAKNDSAIFVNIGIIPRTFCYPNNTRPREKMYLASEGRVGTRTEQRSIGSKPTLAELDKWVEELIKNNGWGVGMTHGITYGYDAFRDQQIFWDHLDKVVKQQDQVWVDTFHDIAAYTEEQKNIRLEISEKKNTINILPVMTLDAELFNVPLTMVIEKNGFRTATVKQGKNKIPVSDSRDKILFDFDPNGGMIQVKIK